MQKLRPFRAASQPDVSVDLTDSTIPPRATKAVAPAESSTASPEDERQHWRFTLWFTGSLVVAWALITFYVGFFARDLQTVEIFGWPVSFYLAAQGGPFLFVLITWLYSAVMDRAEVRAGLSEAEPLD